MSGYAEINTFTSVTSVSHKMKTLKKAPFLKTTVV